ncbi:putative COQ4 protein, responsible for restoring ubiquinone biosynthesis [Mycena belliarum]|uniref:4-hydroxy-3-methoxy-5-polyprenylbenzoate decarboxylase n=1 Tax=Mycena belliarum TaxID=1033014 RepID=A0AAD6TWI5_9AGAR|nr:putative COQ4 protein, responsible for restoring ubiquinone biosynthesis [Mycena belliae]
MAMNGLRSRLPTVSARLSIAGAISRKNVNTRFLGTKVVPAYEGHIPLNWFETGVLTAGAAFMALANPRRGDMVAALGETTAGPALPRLRDIMLSSTEGRQILKDRPRINSMTVDMAKLAQYPEGTLGRAYITWLERCGVTPDTREPVHYIDDPELAYVMQRYRECHDLYHCIVNLPVSVDSEIAVKYFEFANLGLPMAALSALFGPLRLNRAQLQRLFSEYVPWALRCGGSARSLITVYWEQRWEQNVDEMKKELGLWDAPAAKWRKPLTEAKLAAEKRQTAEESRI